MRASTTGPSTFAAAALCALGLTGLVSAVPGGAPLDPPPVRIADASPGACGPAAWPYAACGAAPVRTVRVIAVDAAATGAARR